MAIVAIKGVVICGRVVMGRRCQRWEHGRVHRHWYFSWAEAIGVITDGNNVVGIRVVIGGDMGSGTSFWGNEGKWAWP